MSARTSLSHPLQIAEVSAGANLGKIGITFCPGKKQTSAFSGIWNRDLDLDLKVIQQWGAAAVVTLIEPYELHALQVTDLGDEVRSRHMAWHHLPIRDVSVPGPQFEQAWQEAGPNLRQLLQSGFNVLVHCKGGLGRAGTIAARLMVELGAAPHQAIGQVRAVRPGAIETEAQASHVHAIRPASQARPAQDPISQKDRAVGALLGLAIGDALGTTLEFKRRDTYPPLVDIVGGGPFGLKAGEWTDDTAMALGLGNALLEAGGLDEAVVMAKFTQWYREGQYSCTGRCFDIGITTRSALERWEKTRNPIAGSTDPHTAGNGSLMRLAPVAIRYWRDPLALADAAQRQSRTTHAAQESVDACAAYAALLADAIAGKTLTEVLAPRDGNWHGAIGPIMAGSWRGKPREAIRASGYVAHSLEAALWSVARSHSFRAAVLTAANLGEDADTTAAIAGQLAGAMWGAQAIPAHWLERLAWRDPLESLAERLFEA